jgi:hypothetical protein
MPSLHSSSLFLTGLVVPSLSWQRIVSHKANGIAANRIKACALFLFLFPQQRSTNLEDVRLAHAVRLVGACAVWRERPEQRHITLRETPPLLSVPWVRPEPVLAN